MKNLLLIAIAIFGFSAVSFGQISTSASAETSAIIITPLAIAKKTVTSDLKFGNIIADADGGSVRVLTTGTRNVTGLTDPAATPGIISAAEFTVTGLANATYGISLPSASFTISNGTQTMTVGSFESTPTAGINGGLLSGTGSQDIQVGATLTVGAGQEAGTYTSLTGLTVTVNYN